MTKQSNTFVVTVIRTKKNCNRGSALEWSVGIVGWGKGVYLASPGRLTARQGLLSLQKVWVMGEWFYFCFLTFIPVPLSPLSLSFGGGRMVRRCVSCVTGAYNWYWLTVGQGLLSLLQVRVAGKGRRGMFLFLLFLHYHSCSSFFPVPLSSLLSFFSLSLGDDTKWPTRADVSLNPNTIPFHLLYYFFCLSSRSPFLWDDT